METGEERERENEELSFAPSVKSTTISSTFSHLLKLDFGNKLNGLSAGVGVGSVSCLCYFRDRIVTM